MCKKFHLDPTFCSYDIVRKRKKYQICVLFLEVVTPLSYDPQYLKASSSHHLACVYQDSFRSDISFLRYRAETKQASNFCSIFRSCDLDLCPTDLNIDRLPPSGMCVPSFI